MTIPGLFLWGASWNDISVTVEIPIGYYQDRDALRKDLFSLGVVDGYDLQQYDFFVVLVGGCISIHARDEESAEVWLGERGLVNLLDRPDFPDFGWAICDTQALGKRVADPWLFIDDVVAVLDCAVMAHVNGY